MQRHPIQGEEGEESIHHTITGHSPERLKGEYRSSHSLIVLRKLSVTVNAFKKVKSALTEKNRNHYKKLSNK